MPHKIFLDVNGFLLKTNTNGTIERYKVRLVAKGFHQQPTIYYRETFSLLNKPTTTSLSLSLTITNGWTLSQIGVNNPLLHRTFHEDVFMAQAPCFIDPQFSTHISRLRNVLFGLKHAPRAYL